MLTVNEQYFNILNKCKFIAKPDEWFIEGTECKLDEDVIYPDYKEGDKFNAATGLFIGLTMETYPGYSGNLPRVDSETCPFEEFYIYDEFGNEISELTLGDYKNIFN